MSILPDEGGLAYTMAGYGRKPSRYDAQRTFAQRLAMQGADTSPVQSPWQGVGRLGQALAGAFGVYQANAAEEEAVATEKAEAQSKLAAIMAESDPEKQIALASSVDPKFGLQLTAQLAVKKAEQGNQRKMLESAANSFGSSYGMGGQTGGGQTMAPQQAQAAAQQKIQYLVQNHGLTPEQASTMVGNLYQESGFNPTATHDGGTGYGMGGWRLERRDALMKAAQAAGRDPADPGFQLDFYANEFKGRPEFQKFQQAQTPEARQAAMMDYFRPAGWTPQNPQGGHGYNNRLQYGQQFAQAGGPQIPQGSADGMPPQPTPQGVTGPTLQAPALPQRLTPKDLPQEIKAQFIDRFRRGGYGPNPAEAETRMVQDMQRFADASFESQKLEYSQKFENYKDERKRGADAPGKIFEQEGKMRDDFGREPAVKSYRTVVPMLEAAKDAASRPTRAADLNLVYAFAKMMDPESVVRESETAGVQATATVADRLGAYIGQLNGQPMLSPETRQKLIAELESRFGTLKSSYDATLNAYSGAAQSYGLNPERMFFNIRPDTPKPAGEGGKAIPPPPSGFRPL